MARLAGQLFARTDAKHIPRELDTTIFEQIHALRLWLPRGHSMGSALLVYASAWFKRYYPGRVLHRAATPLLPPAEPILAVAERMRVDLQNPDRSKVPLKHDRYLKIWALARPRIYREFLLPDEAQDTNPMVEPVFIAQCEHAQLVMVGASAQAIYGWRGTTT